MANKVLLGPASIEKLKTGKLFDPLTPGLRIEALGSGKKVWKYYRRLGDRHFLRQTLGAFPAHSIGAARQWAAALNEKVDAGIDPRELERDARDRASMTVRRAHTLYMIAVEEGRATRAKRRNKPRTIADKRTIYRRDIEPKLGNRLIYDVTEQDLIKLVRDKGRVARVRANRLAAELMVFFGWAASLRGLDVGLESNPARRLGDLKFPETARSRALSIEELGWFLKALVEEERTYQRGFLLCLLTAARISEVVRASAAEVRDGAWIIDGARVKNSRTHRVALGPWGRSLMLTNAKWVFPAPKGDGPQTSGWYKARDRIARRMAAYAGHELARWTPHDLRRTARSNTKRLKVDFETAEAMLNHVKTGMERTYDAYDLEEEKKAWFLKWEKEVIRVAREAGVAEALGVPTNPGRPIMSLSMSGYTWSPQGAGIQPRLHFG